MLLKGHSLASGKASCRPLISHRSASVACCDAAASGAHSGGFESLNEFHSIPAGPPCAVLQCLASLLGFGLESIEPGAGFKYSLLSDEWTRCRYRARGWDGGTE